MPYDIAPAVGRRAVVPVPAGAGGLGVAGDASLAEALHTGVGRVAGQLAAAVGPDGAVRGRCASRVLDSALALRLVREGGGHPGRQALLAGFLARAEGDASCAAFDRALAGGVLRGRPVPEAAGALDGLLAEFDHFTAARKRVMFALCLAVTGAAGYPEDLDPDALRPAPSDVHWVRLILLALRVLLAYGTGRAGAVGDDVRALREMLALPEGTPAWENHVTAHLLATLALQRAQPGSPLVGACTERVMTCQNPDGGLPGIARLEPFATGPAGLALVRAGVTPRAVPERAGDFLTGWQQPGGGWSFGTGTRQPDVDTTAYALAFLRRMDRPRHRAAVRAGVAYLRATANPDGGFPTYVRGSTSEIAMTAGATVALAAGAGGPAGASSGLDGVLGAAVRYMLDGQRPDGTFERSWSLSEANAMWRVLWALRAVPASVLGAGLAERRERAADRAVRRLAGGQNADGGWGHRPGDPSDVTSTAYSVLAFTDGGRSAAHRAELRRAALFLLSRVSPEGRLTAPPDQVAPRPVLFDAPVFTETWGLLALSGLRDALRA